MSQRRLSEIVRDLVYKRNLLLVFIISIAVAIFVFMITFQIDKRSWFERIDLISSEWYRVIDNYQNILNFFVARPGDFKNPGDILEVLKLIREHFGDYIAYPI
ncbi:MAG: hypothetical protein PWQ80_1179, partial [Thermotoga sp.]|nr:hypothetical protein [Thermotoga sp.]